jgi:hypothetical protein
MRKMMVLIVYLAGAILLGHNFVPHHHEVATSKTSHAHAEHEHHHAPETDHQEQSPSDWQDHNREIGIAVVKKVIKDLTPDTLNYLPGDDEPILLKLSVNEIVPDKPGARDLRSYSSSYYSCISHRGPPSLV